MPIELHVRRSSVVLHFELDGQGEKSGIVFLRDGQLTKLNWAGSSATAQFLLQDDVERHVAAFIIQGSATCVSFNVEVHIFRTWKVAGREFISAPKWTEAEFKFAALEYISALPKFNRNRSFTELAKFRVVRGDVCATPKLLQLLHDRLIDFGVLVSRLSRSDLADYAAVEQFDIDVEQTLDFLRSHPSVLIEASGGPVEVHGKRYTPAEAMPAFERLRKIDLTVPLELLNQCVVFLEARPELSVARQILNQSTSRVKDFHCAGINRASGSDINKWLTFIPQNVAAREFKSQILALWQLCGQVADTLDSEAPLSRILRNDFRDFDLFEWSVLLGVCRALGFSGQSTETRQMASIDCASSVVVNPNIETGAKLAASLLPGWRDAGEFPGKYRPDVVINYERRCPIPVDAKFRVADAFGDPCGADSFKEVQAYLNEFGVSGAVIVVPSMPSRLGQSTCGAMKIQGRIREKEYRVWVIEYSPIRAGFSHQLANALTDIADLESVALSA